jgi:hypothetical protein
MPQSKMHLLENAARFSRGEKEEVRLQEIEG